MTQEVEIMYRDPGVLRQAAKLGLTGLSAGTGALLLGSSFDLFIRSALYTTGSHASTFEIFNGTSSSGMLEAMAPGLSRLVLNAVEGPNSIWILTEASIVSVVAINRLWRKSSRPLRLRTHAAPEPAANMKKISHI